MLNYPIVILTLLVMSLPGCSKPPEVTSEAAQTPKIADNEEIKQKALAKKVEACKVRAKDYEKLILSGDEWGAAEAVRECAKDLNDKTMLEQLRQAELKGYEKLIRDKTSEPLARILAIDNLIASYPDKAAEYEKLREKLVESDNRGRQIETAAAERKEVAKRKREGVRIGMSREEVIASSWGKPQRINRTTNAYGEHEQWVYGGGNYLYFDDGRLTTIQN